MIREYEDEKVNVHILEMHGHKKAPFQAPIHHIQCLQDKKNEGQFLPSLA